MTVKYINNILFFDEVNVLDFAKTNQTPFYLYSQNLITHNFMEYTQNLNTANHLLCYSVKANSNLSILSILSDLGSGFDIVSAGELQRVIAAGGDPAKTVFSGVGKTEEEIKFALSKNILCFNIESQEELNTLNKIALAEKKIANVSVRVNPAIDVKTHPYITTGMRDNKFGIDESEIINLYQEANDHKGLNIRGIDFHIGSQITSLEPFIDALSKVISIIKELKSLKIELEHIDIGGGLGISYDKKPIVSKEDFSKEILKLVEPLELKLLIEPGRSIVGDAGILVTKVINTKKSPSKNFLIVDAGMNDLIRPPLYSAYHAIKEVSQTKNKKILSDVVGPVCETADFLGKDRMLSVKQGDYLCVENVGAYGFVLSSNYNTRPKIDEYLAKDTDIKKIRIRDTIEQILENEKKCLV
tara:strand:- start:153 stop:1397 length:1245 start_codon:yes stop_codon:yes gene_type:complete